MHDDYHHFLRHGPATSPGTSSARAFRDHQPHNQRDEATNAPIIASTITTGALSQSRKLPHSVSRLLQRGLSVLSKEARLSASAFSISDCTCGSTDLVSRLFGSGFWGSGVFAAAVRDGSMVSADRFALRGVHAVSLMPREVQVQANGAPPNGRIVVLRRHRAAPSTHRRRPGGYGNAGEQLPGGN